MFKKIILSLVVSSSLLLANNVETIEKNGTSVNKQVLKDHNLSITIDKGYFDSDKNEILYLLNIVGNSDQDIYIEDKKLTIEANKTTKAVVAEAKLESFLSNVKFEQKVKNRIELQKMEHQKEMGQLKSAAKAKLMEILEYTKKLENNILNLKEGIKQMEKTHISKVQLDKKDEEIQKLTRKVMELSGSEVNRKKYEIVVSQLNEMKSKLNDKDYTISKLQEEVQKRELELKANNSSIALLNKLKSNIEELPNSYDKEILVYTIEDMKSIFK